MLFKRAVTALLFAGASLAAPAQKRNKAFKWGSDKIRGLNIGGWLVLEPWITPSIFQQFPNSAGVVDEYTLGKYLGAEKAYNEVLKPHWDTWVTYNDFKKIADAGFNLVRIPVGYWAFDTFGSPYVSGAAPYIDAAIDWARGTGLKVLLDLHGAPGSQNGFDNSGQRVDNPQWLSGETKAQTLQVIETLANKYASDKYSDVIAGIQLMNEPLMSKLNNDDSVKDYYRQGFSKVRSVSSDTTVVLHDGFKPPNTWNGFLTPSDNNAQNVAVDHHEYQVFDLNQITWQPWQHRQFVCNNYQTYNGADKWTFVGEWTAAMTDCAPALNGYLIGARYDGTYPGSSFVGKCDFQNNIDQWSQTYKDDTRGYIEAQLEVFEAKFQGWIFWNFKTEAAAEWDAFKLLDAGVFPQPLSSRKFDMVCSNL